MRFVSPDTWVVGIDDTDMPGIGGTGRLARRLAAEVEARGIGRSMGVTRHQFYEGPGVPKTARNSAAAIAFEPYRLRRFLSFLNPWDRERRGRRPSLFRSLCF